MKNLIVLAVLAVAMLAINSVSAISCLGDSDGGNNATVSGYVTALIPAWPRSLTYNVYDTCVFIAPNIIRLREYYCENWVLKFMTYACTCIPNARGARCA